MNRYEGELEFFVRDVRCKNRSLRNEYGTSGIEFLDGIIGGLHNWQDDAFSKYLETRFSLPKSWIFDDREIIFRRSKTDEFQACIMSVGLEILAGAKNYTMTALAQFFSNRDERVYVARAADSAKEDCACVLRSFRFISLFMCYIV